LNELETGKLSVQWSKASIEDFKPELANIFQESFNEDLKKIAQRNSKEAAENKDDCISLRPSWAKKR